MNNTHTLKSTDSCKWLTSQTMPAFCQPHSLCLPPSSSAAPLFSLYFLVYLLGKLPFTLTILPKLSVVRSQSLLGQSLLLQSHNMHGRRSSLRGSQEDSAIVHQPASLRRERSITGSTSGGSPIAHPPSHRSSPACSSAQPSGNQARIDLGVARYPSANPSTGRARVASMPAPHPAVIINSVRKEAVFAPSPLSRVVARVPPPTDLDNESYRLAKACGQDALSASASSPAGWAFLGSEDPASLSQQPLTTSQSVSSLGAALNTLATSGQHLSTQPPPRFPHPSVYDVLGVFVKELRRQHLSLHDWIDPDALYTEVRDKPTEEIRSNPGEDARTFNTSIQLSGHHLTSWQVCLVLRLGNFMS